MRGRPFVFIADMRKYILNTDTRLDLAMRETGTKPRDRERESAGESEVEGEREKGRENVCKRESTAEIKEGK